MTGWSRNGTGGTRRCCSTRKVARSALPAPSRNNLESISGSFVPGLIAVSSICGLPYWFTSTRVGSELDEVATTPEGGPQHVEGNRRIARSRFAMGIA